VVDPVSPTTGWGVVHLFCKVGPLADAEEIASAVKRAESQGDQVVTIAILGHKADVCFMIVGDDLWRLRQLQAELAAAGLDVVDSYVSLTELSEYATHLPETVREARLHPQLPPPDKPAWCFYPMSKRRASSQNWYALPFDERKELMAEHGKSGRTFAGRVVQLITGSAGLDDYEWGVTLFAGHPDDLKEVVYTMRFDEVSAHYADFGPFYTGMIAPVEAVLARIGLASA
jgi:chlorite dismutase